MEITDRCNCNETFDIRCCCWVNDNTFDTCNRKVSTTYSYMMNKYELYTKIQNRGIDSVEIYIKDVCRLNDNQWNEIVNMYKEENEEG